MTDGFDWEALTDQARAAMAHAYVPYSHYPVGAAAVVDDGRVVSGCNVENAAYGVALCAECGLVSQLHITGGGRLTGFLTSTYPRPRYPASRVSVRRRYLRRRAWWSRRGPGIRGSRGPPG